MPDAQVKVFHGDFPDREVTEKMRLGEKFLWIPDSELRKMGCTPTLYIMQKYGAPHIHKRHTILMPYPSIPGHLAPRG